MRGPTIEVQVQALVGPVLAECVRQRTAFGVAKYGQRLEDNHQPDRAKSVHLVQELLDAAQYATWRGNHGMAEMLGVMADAVVAQDALTVEEIMAGGKQ